MMILCYCSQKVLGKLVNDDMYRCFFGFTPCSQRKFSSLLFSNRFSIFSSTSSPSGIPMMQILLHFMFSCTYLNPSLFFLSLFSFSWLFYLVLELTISILCFIQRAFYSFYCFFSSEVVFFISSWPFLILSVSLVILI